jgi:hypothetical protein
MREERRFILSRQDAETLLRGAPLQLTVGGELVEILYRGDLRRRKKFDVAFQQTTPQDSAAELSGGKGAAKKTRRLGTAGKRRTRRQFSAAYKRKVVAMVDKNQTAWQVSKKVGIAHSVIRDWVRGSRTAKGK